MAVSESLGALNLFAEHSDGVVRIRARGELDMATAPVLEGALLAVEELTPARIVLDFEGVTFMDSSALHTLLRAHGRAAENDRVLIVMNGHQGVRKMFELTGTDHLLNGNGHGGLPAPSLDELAPWSQITIPGIDSG